MWADASFSDSADMGLLASVVAVIAGVGSFSAASAVAIALVFVGVDLVTRSKSRAEIESASQTGDVTS